jgi:MerR family copper efflux transcriptional regulator
MKQLTIGHLAKEVDLRTSAIRYYEEKGLIQPAERNSSGYRLYDPTVVEEIKLLQRAQNLGFSLSDIKILLEGWREGNLNHEAFLETAENRYLALEREVTALLALRHELGLFLQDVYQSSPLKTPATLLSELIDHICIDPGGSPAVLVFDRLLERVGCNLTSEAVKRLMHDLEGEHIHVWNENGIYSILIVSDDPRIAGVLQQFVEIASDCQAPEHTHLVPDWMHHEDGYLLTVEGEHAFIVARMFLEVGRQKTSLA